MSNSNESTILKNAAATPLALIVAGADGPEPRIWGMTGAERQRRALQRNDFEEIVTTLPAGIDIGTVLMLRADWVLDESLVRSLKANPGTVLYDETGATPIGAHVAAGDAARIAGLLRDEVIEPGIATLRHERPSTIGQTYDTALRKRGVPYALHLVQSSVPAIERRMFDGSYKGVTDFVTKYVWPRPAERVTRWCATHGISPNQVTLLSLVLVFAVLWLFAVGWFLPGLLLAWAMTFLDTVDGKLARVTLTSTPMGNVFDHGIDLVHPPFWWWAWWVGLTGIGVHLPGWMLAVVLIGYVAQRLLEGAFLALFGIEMHIWRRFDSFFRLITARRNPNLVLFTLAALVGRPDVGFVLVAVWTALSLAVHALQVVQALVARRRGAIGSWLHAA